MSTLGDFFVVDYLGKLDIHRAGYDISVNDAIRIMMSSNFPLNDTNNYDLEIFDDRIDFIDSRTDKIVESFETRSIARCHQYFSDHSKAKFPELVVLEIRNSLYHSDSFYALSVQNASAKTVTRAIERKLEMPVLRPKAAEKKAPSEHSRSRYTVDIDKNSVRSYVSSRSFASARSRQSTISHYSTEPIIKRSMKYLIDFDEMPSLKYDNSNDKYLKQKILLNYCLDDVENFVFLVKKCSKKLTIKKTFNGTDFMRTFTKIKIAINLLANLRDYLDEPSPSASDIVQCLFSPLMYLMDICTHTFGDNIAKNVYEPVLTKTAINFLDANLSGDEYRIWRDLGMNWTAPLPSYKNPPPCKIKFDDGWSPGILEFSNTPSSYDRWSSSSESESSSETNTIVGELENRESDLDKVSEKNSGRESSVSSLEESFAILQNKYRDEIMTKKGRIALSTHTWRAENLKELSVAKGEYLEIQEDSTTWWKVKNRVGHVGILPASLLKVIHFGDADEERNGAKPSVPPPPPIETRQNSTIRPSQPVFVSNHHQQMHQPQYDPHQYIPTYNGYYKSQPPPVPRKVAPPPPPPPQMPPNYMRRTNSMVSIDSINTMHNELKEVIQIYKPKTPVFNIKKLPDEYITQRSKPEEVKNWLMLKEFSPRVLTKLEGLTGEQLFGLKRAECEAVFGKNEGGKLFSQITISRSIDGYSTTKEANLELKKVLKFVRDRSENENPPESNVTNA